jgi:IclR family acetate operon transcriptional repressor
MREADAPPAPSASDDAPRPAYVIGSALRTLDVLKAFAEPPHRFGLADLVATMGLERNQVYRSLKTLEAAELLQQGEDARFELAGPLVALGAAAARGRSVSLLDVARPFLDELLAATSETVHLFVRDGDHAVCVDRRESPQGVRMAASLGRTVPLHAGAVPKAMLAHLSEDERAAVMARLPSLPRYTERTELDPDRLEAQLARIRAQGVAVSDEDYDPSARGVGAPIFDDARTVVAGVSVGGPSFRVDDATLDRFTQLVRAAAEGISRQLALTGRS